MSPQSPLDSVRQILAELDISLLRVNSHAEQSTLIENALKRLRLLFTKSKMLFTESVVQQINAYKALLKPPPTAGLAPVALPGTASTTPGSKPAREPHGHNFPLTAGSTWSFVLAVPDGRPCPSRDLVNLREGITDYRCLRTLEQAIAAAKQCGRAPRAVAEASSFLDELRKEIDHDLTRTYGGWSANDAGGENWHPRDGRGITAERVEQLRRLVAAHLKALGK